MRSISVQAFRSVFEQCFRSKSIPQKIAIGLSGGPDSMLLAWLLQKYKADMGHKDLELHAITIDHNYRANSTSEAEQISPIMKQWNVKHVIRKLHYDVDPKTIANFEEVARTKRYEAINSICNMLGISVVVLGHHCDDQVETFVQRLQGNSSIFGLACTRKISNIPFNSDLNPVEQAKMAPVRLLRPLLEFEKSEILSTCNLKNIPYVIDPTNNDTKLTRRNYLRNLFGVVLPQMMDGQSTEEHKMGVVPNPQYQSITKSELIKSQQQCAKFAQDFESKAYQLYRKLLQEGKFSESPAFGSLRITLPKECLNGCNKIVTSRFFYQRLYPYSTLNHYHWAYAKLERSLLPKLELLSNTSKSGEAKICIMNLIFTVTYNVNSPEIEIDISRAPLTRTELRSSSLEVSLRADWSQWHLFDKRFWLRLQSCGGNPTSVIIAPYLHKVHFPLVSNKIKETTSPSKRMDALPVIFHKGKIVAFPTLRIPDSDIQIEWALKANKYDYVEPII